MAAAPAFPPSLTFFTSSSLVEIGTELDAGDLPSAKARFEVLTNIPKKLHADISALFREIEAAPKLASTAPAAISSTYSLRIQKFISEAHRERAEFLAALPSTADLYGGQTYLLLMSQNLSAGARLYLQQSSERNDYTRYLKEFYIAMNHFYNTDKTDELLRTINSFFLKIASQPPKERTRWLPKSIVLTKLEFESLAKHFTSRFTSFRTALNYSDPVQLKRTAWENDENVKISQMATFGYQHLNLLQRAFNPIIDLLVSMHPDEVTIVCNESDLKELSVILKSRFSPRCCIRMARKAFELHDTVRQKYGKVMVEIAAAYHRCQQLYNPIFENPHVQNLFNNCTVTPELVTFLETQEEWLKDLPIFLKEFQQRLNQNITFLISQFKRLLHLHMWIYVADDLATWEKENQRFDQLVSTLEGRVTRLGLIGAKKMQAVMVANPTVRAYRKSLQHNMDSLHEMLSAVNGMFNLYMLPNIDNTQFLRSPKNLKVTLKWSATKPLLQYHKVRWPNGNITNLTRWFTELGLKPPKLQFDFRKPLSAADIPFLNAIQRIDPVVVNRCLLILQVLAPGGSICLFPDPVAAPSPGHTERLEEPTVEEPIDDIDAEVDAKAAAARPVPAFKSAVVYQIRDFLLEKFTQVQSKEKVSIKKTVKEAEQKLRICIAFANSIERGFRNPESVHAQVFHSCVSIVEQINLILEQLLRAIDLKTNPMAPVTHDLKTLIERNKDLLCYLNVNEYRTVLDVNFAGFDTRDIALLAQRGKTESASQKLLLAAFNYRKTGEMLPKLMEDLGDYNHSAMNVISTLLDYLINPKIKATRSLELSNWSIEWGNKLKQLKLVPAPTMPTTPLQRTIYSRIAELRHFVDTLRDPKLLIDSDFDPYFENLNQKLDRLNAEIENQSCLTENEWPGHLSVVLNLTHLIAADLLHLNLFALEHLGHPVSVPDERSSLEELVNAHPELKLPPHLEDFIKIRARNIARYSETLDGKEVGKKTATGAKQMRRVASAAAASPAAPYEPETFADAEADAKAGFIKTESRIAIETKAKVGKQIQLLAELIASLGLPR